MALGASQQPCWVGNTPISVNGQRGHQPSQDTRHCFRSWDQDSTSACQGCPKGTAGVGVGVCNLGCQFCEAGTLMPFVSQMRGLRQGRPHRE